MNEERAFRSTVGPHRAAILLHALEQGVEDVLEVEARHVFREKRTGPTLVFDFVTTALANSFASDIGVKHTTQGQQHWWLIEDQYALRVKKLNGPRLITRNARTGQQQTVDHQELELEGVNPTVVTVGPRYSPRTGLATGFLAVKHTVNGRGRLVAEWWVDLRDLAGGVLAPTTTPLPQAGPTIASTVVSKRTKKISPTEIEER